MARKEKSSGKKSEATAKRGESATADLGKNKKAGKERFRGKGKSFGISGSGDDLGAELAALGLRIKDITGDGNCFFRALSDQLQGDEQQHVHIRQRIVSYMVDNQDDFAPFVEDDETFESYVARMKKDGVWAGYMEVVAASRCLQANLTIYQAGQPRWRVIHHPEDSTPMLHLSYHDGQHYNSVRCTDDYGTGPPTPIAIRGDGMVAARPPLRSTGDGSWDEKDERRVASSTACTDMALILKALDEARGDVEAAIERVIEALAAKPAEPVAATAEADAEGPQEIAEAATTVSAAALQPLPPTAAPLEAAADLAGPSSDQAVCDEAATTTAGNVPGSNDTVVNEDTDGATSTAAIVATVGPSSSSTPPTPPAEATLVPGSGPGLGKGIRVSGTRVAAVGKAAASRKTAAGLMVAPVPSNNKRCPCGSNKKYKACCGPVAAAAERRRAASGARAADAEAKLDTQSDERVLVAQVAALVI